MQGLFRALFVFALSLVPLTAQADTDNTVLVLDFELYDLTLTPNSAAELARTASVAPLLRDALLADHDIQTVAPDTAAQQAADHGVGYLFNHPNAAAELGRQANTRWVAVGRLHKPTDLFAFLKVNLIDVASGKPAAAFIVEVKGPSRQVTAVGVEVLAAEMAQALAEQADDS